jgi:hypothetical protein
VTGFDREERHVVIDATPGPGKPGRVDTRNFFSSASTMPVGSRPLPIVEKSQNKAQQQRGKETEEDLYAGIISGLALGRELAYRHAREVERLGVPALQGSEGLGAFLFIAALILSAVIGAGLFIDGVSHGRALEAIIGSILIGGVASVFGLAGSDWNQPPAHVVEISVGP